MIMVRESDSFWMEMFSGTENMSLLCRDVVPESVAVLADFNCETIPQRISVHAHCTGHLGTPCCIRRPDLCIMIQMSVGRSAFSAATQYNRWTRDGSGPALLHDSTPHVGWVLVVRLVTKMTSKLLHLSGEWHYCAYI